MLSRQAYRAVPLAFLLACASAQAQEGAASQLLLAPGKSVTFVDPANPGLQILITAPADKPLDLSGLITASEKGGTFSAVIGSQIRAAGRVAMNPDGSISLREAAPASSIVPGAAPVTLKGVTIEGGIVVMNPGNTVIHSDRIVQQPTPKIGAVPVATPSVPAIPFTAGAAVAPNAIVTVPVSVTLPASGAIALNPGVPLSTGTITPGVITFQTFNGGSGNSVPVTLPSGGAIVMNSGTITLNSSGVISGSLGTPSGSVSISNPGGTITIAPGTVMTGNVTLSTTGAPISGGAVTTTGQKGPPAPVIVVK